MFLPVLIWNAEHDWASFRFQSVRAIATHELSLRTVGEFIGLQFGLVGFVLLPVVLSGVTLTAWRGYRRREPVAILLSTSVLVPFCYFFWKSLTLRVGDTWPMFLWPAGFAAAAINIAMLPRENWPAWMIRSTITWANIAVVTGIAYVVLVFLYYVVAPWNFIGGTDPIGGEAGYQQVADRARSRTAEDRRDLDRDHGLPHLRDDALVLQGSRAGDPDQRARTLHGLSRSRHGSDQGPCRALCRARDRQGQSGLGSTTARREPLERVDRDLARHRDGHLRAGESDRLDAGAFAAAGYAAVSLARAGGRGSDRSRPCDGG